MPIFLQNSKPMAVPFGLIVYMCADDDINTSNNTYLKKLHQNLKAHKAEGGVPFLIAVQCTKKWPLNITTKRVIMLSNEVAGEADSDLPWAVQRRANPGSQVVLYNFLDAVKQANPTLEHYVLVIWGHGGIFFTFSGSLDPHVATFGLLSQTWAGTQNVNVASDFAPTGRRFGYEEVKRLVSRLARQSVPGVEPLEWLPASMQVNALGEEIGDVQTTALRLLPTLPLAAFFKAQATALLAYYDTLPADAPAVAVLDETIVPPSAFGILPTQLGIEEIHWAITKAGMAGQIDLLVFNNCCMQNAENLFSLSTSVKYILGSQDYLYRDEIALAYELEALFKFDPNQVSLMASRLIDDFPLHVRPANAADAWAYSLVRANMLQAFVQDHFEPLIMALTNNANALKTNITQARNCCESVTDDGNNNTPDIQVSMVDLIWFLQNLQHFLTAEPQGAAVKVLITNCLQALKAGSGLVAKSVAGPNREAGALGQISYGCQGLNIMFPATKQEWQKLKQSRTFSSYFALVSPKAKFYKDSGWRNFLDVYYS